MPGSEDIGDMTGKDLTGTAAGVPDTKGVLVGLGAALSFRGMDIQLSCATKAPGSTVGRDKSTELPQPATGCGEAVGGQKTGTVGAPDIFLYAAMFLLCALIDRETRRRGFPKHHFLWETTQAMSDEPLLPSRGLSFNHAAPGFEGSHRLDHCVDPRFRSVIDLDQFLQNIYVYWLHHGYWPYVIRQLFQVVTLALVLLVLLLLTCFIDYAALFQPSETDLLDAFTLRTPHPVVWGLLLVSVVALVLRAMKLRHDLTHMGHTRVFLNQVLLLSDEQLCHMSWEDVVGQLLPVYESLQGHNHNVNTDAILVRLMRMEQFIIALSRADLLSLHLWHGWPDCILSLPFLAGLWIALQPLLNDRDPLDTPEQMQRATRNLRWRVVGLGLAGLLVSPFALILVLVYYACRYGERVRSTPSFFGTRHWSLRAQWCTRNYNELPHHVRARLEGAEPAAQKYIDATVNRMVPAIAQFGLFLCSTACVLILALALVDDDLLIHKTLLGRVLVWWLAVAASGVAVCRMLDASPSGYGESGAAQRHHNIPQLVTDLAVHLQVHPEHVRCHMRSYYEHRVAGFAWELASVVLAPLLFLCMLHPRCVHIVAFVRSHSRVEFGMGRVLQGA